MGESMSGQLSAGGRRGHEGDAEPLARNEVGWQVDGLPTVALSVASLLPADSPRIGGEDSEHVRSLAALSDTKLPPIVVHRPAMRVIDGMHRLRAAALRGEDKIEVCFFEGSDAEAFVLAVRLNSMHGLPLSQVDRAAAAARIIDSHPQWSNRVIASIAGLSDKTVASIRRCSTAEIPQSNVRVGRDGRTRPVNSAEGRRRAGLLFSERPNASLREIAGEAGIAISTARDVRERVRLGKDPILPRQRQAPIDRTSSESKTWPKPETGNGRARVSGANSLDTLQHLRNDPSLRFSEVNRSMLRLLDAHSMKVEHWDRLVRGVPEHCRPAVTEAARACSELWLSFARQLEGRTGDGDR